MGVDGAPLYDTQRRGRDGLHSGIVGARRNGALDLGLKERLERLEYGILQINGECEQPIQELTDGRQLLLERPAAIGQCEAGRLDEALQRAALDLAGVEQHVELAQSSARVHALQVVLRAEQALSSGLALALGDRAEAVEAPGDGGEEALLRL